MARTLSVIVALVLLAVTASASKNVVTTTKIGSRTRVVTKSPSFDQALATRLHPSLVAPTDPPFTQPKDFIFQGGNWCSGNMTLARKQLVTGDWVSAPSHDLWAGGGGGGFVVKHTMGNVVINGSLAYMSTHGELQLAFVAVQNEWELAAEYPTVIDGQVFSADIGHQNFYAMWFGKWPLPAGQASC